MGWSYDAMRLWSAAEWLYTNDGAILWDKRLYARPLIYYQVAPCRRYGFVFLGWLRSNGKIKEKQGLVPSWADFISLRLTIHTDGHVRDIDNRASCFPRPPHAFDD